MGPLAIAWLVGEGIITYRTVKNQHCPPGPGQLLLSSGVFILLALLAEAPSARTLAITLAWGFDVAAFMNVASVGTGKASGVKWPPGYMANTTIFPVRTETAETGTEQGTSSASSTGADATGQPMLGGAIGGKSTGSSNGTTGQTGRNIPVTS